MSRKVYDLAVPTEKYTSGNEEKTIWENVGAVYESDNGGFFMRLKAHFNPAAIQRQENSDSIIVNMFSAKRSV